jgi:transcriptional regulator with XRE-family HTH domain
MTSQAIADRNVHAQTGLLAALTAVRTGKRMSVEDVAGILGVEPAVVESIEEGQLEMNLTELRQYAYAVGAVVEYEVVPANRGETPLVPSSSIGRASDCYSDGYWFDSSDGSESRLILNDR